LPSPFDRPKFTFKESNTTTKYFLRIFWEVVDLERGPLTLVTTIEEVLERKSNGFGLENRDYDHRDPLR
jgi:hypothetical protein